MKKTAKWTLFLIGILLLLGAGGGLFYLGMQNTADSGKEVLRGTIPVTAVTLKRSDFELGGEYAARLEALRDVTITAKVGGTVVEDMTKEGDRIARGQALYRIEEEPYLFAMEQAEAALDLAREHVRKTRNISRPELIRRLEAVVAERRTALEKAGSDAARFEKLFDEGAVPLSQKEGADLALSSAGARMKIARENLEEAKSGARAEDRAAAEATVRQAEAAYRLARDSWEKCVVRAPLAGTVASKKVFAGDTVRPGSPVAEVVDLRAFKINFGVSADDIGHFPTGTQVTVVPLDEDLRLKAVVKYAGVKADGETGSFPVILEMDNPDSDQAHRRFRAGMDVAVRFIKHEAKQVIVIPASALVREIDRTLVFLVEADTARRREVAVGVETEGEAVIESGLAEGQVLVIVGQQRLRDGDKVEITFEQ